MAKSPNRDGCRGSGIRYAWFRGFYLRDAAEWDALCRDAGLIAVNVETLQFEQITPNGLTKRHTIRVTARA